MKNSHSTTRSARGGRGWWFALVASAVGVAALSVPPAERGAGRLGEPMLPRRELLQVLGAGYRQLLADYYWLQTSALVGEAGTAPEYRDAYFYLDLVTDLDPQFRFAYVFGGTVIPFNRGREEWVNTEESTRLLEKGRAQFPQDVFLRVLNAYNLSYFHKEHRRAALLLEETARLPGAPAYLGPLATRLFAQSGDVQKGLDLAESLAESATDPETRARFEERRRELELERVLQQVDRAAAAFERLHGAAPRAVSDLVGPGMLERLPVDPLGGLIYIGDDRRAHSTSQQRRLEVFDPRHSAREGS